MLLMAIQGCSRLLKTAEGYSKLYMLFKTSKALKAVKSFQSFKDVQGKSNDPKHPKRFKTGSFRVSVLVY